jgi:hypothetical protein
MVAIVRFMVDLEKVSKSITRPLSLVLNHKNATLFERLENFAKFFPGALNHYNRTPAHYYTP